MLALEPWSARLKMPLITPGASSDTITETVAKDYERNKYTFHGYIPSGAQAGLACAAAKDLIVGAFKMKTAVILSEEAAWTIPLDAGYADCLPAVGLKVIDHIRFSQFTANFTAIFNKIANETPDVIFTGMSHVGVQPTIQWKGRQLPIPMFGVSLQATHSGFWNDTNGATDGVLYAAISGPGVAVTETALPFIGAFRKT